jgi:hypothetical protein
MIQSATQDNETARSVIRWSVLLGFLFCLTPWTSVARVTADQVAKKLAGPHGHEWVFQKWETFLGPGNRCKRGESYRFTPDHQVTISTCVEGHVQTETKPWSIDLQDPPDTKLKIGDTLYLLILWDSPEGHFMILRTKPPVKTEPTVDKKFQLQED